jgi:glycosyltransferase involved in cell wall biosynthesis
MILYPKDNWILQRSGEELEGLEMNGTYFLNYYLFDDSKPKPWGAFFTHLESRYMAKIEEVASKADYAVCLNESMKEWLELRGVRRVEIIRHGHDERVKKTPTFGVVGKVYPGGRKGEELVNKMVDEGYKVIANGEGWPCPIQGGYEDLPLFYDSIDYLVITSTNEGGPVPLVDALAAGVPVIAPMVGYCWEFPVIRYKKGNWESLHKVLDNLTSPPTWKEWREKHQELFRSVSKNS